MDDINKALADGLINNLKNAFDGEIDSVSCGKEEYFSFVSRSQRTDNWMPDKPTVCKMEVLAIETKDNFNGSPLITKEGVPYINLKMKGTDVNNSLNTKTIYEKLYANNKEKAYAVTEALRLNIPNLNKCAVKMLVGGTGYAEINSQEYLGKDGTTKRKVIISKWLIDFDESALPIEQEVLPF